MGEPMTENALLFMRLRKKLHEGKSLSRKDIWRLTDIVDATVYAGITDLARWALELQEENKQLREALQVYTDGYVYRESEGRK
jgi:hypothetical protein